MESIWQKVFIRIQKGLVKSTLAGSGWFCKWVTGQGEESKHSSAKISPTRHRDPQSSFSTYPYLVHEQYSALASVQHRGPITWDSASDSNPPNLCTGDSFSAGGRSTWNTTSSRVLLHMWNLYNMIPTPPVYFMTRYSRSHPLGEQKHTKKLSMELSQK